MTAALPFRFKAGGNGETPQPHHHRSTTKVANKPFKSHHATKGALKEIAKGKLEGSEKGKRQTRQQQVMSKIDRKNRAKQKRQNDHHALQGKTAIFGPKVRASRIVAVVPLHATASAAAAISDINSSYRIHDELPSTGSMSIKIPSQKTTIQYIALLPKDLFTILDACRVADYVVFVLSAEGLVDDFGDLVLTAAKAQGISLYMMAAQVSLGVTSYAYNLL